MLIKPGVFYFNARLAGKWNGLQRIRDLCRGFSIFPCIEVCYFIRRSRKIRMGCSIVMVCKDWIPEEGLSTMSYLRCIVLL